MFSKLGSYEPKITLFLAKTPVLKGRKKGK